MSRTALLPCRTAPPRRLVTALGLLGCVCALPARAQDPPQLLNQESLSAAAAAQTTALAATPSVGPFQAVVMLRGGEDRGHWSIRWVMTQPRERTAVGVSTLALAGLSPSWPGLGVVAVLRAGARPTEAPDWYNCWTVVDPNVVRPVNPDLLLRVQDRTGIPKLTDNEMETQAYVETLLQAYQTTDKAFRDVDEGDLDPSNALRKPKQCRGHVYRVEGRLRLLRRYDAPSALRRAWGMRDVYEGWIYNERKFGKKTPVGVLLTELPPGLEPGEDLDVPVDFVGYYYKLLRVPIQTEGKADSVQEGPLLMGHSLRLLPTAEEEEPSNW
jgi:hypothetical protein